MSVQKTLVKIKKLVPNAVIPKYAKEGDAGMDLVAVSKITDKESGIASFGTGIAIEIPKGYVGLIFPRSSIYKMGSLLTNSVGVIDSGYRGEISAKFYEDHTSGERYEIGDKICQLIIMPFPTIEFVESKELVESERGENGYGSTGR